MSKAHGPRSKKAKSIGGLGEPVENERAAKSLDSTKDKVIVVMGPTGAGKSSFIETATRQCDQTIGHGLRSCTANIRTVKLAHPTDPKYPAVVFVDTPGFDDTYKSDTEILSMIADWLVKTYKERVKLAGIIYLHRISDNRMTGASLKNLHMFEGVCGQDAMPSVALVTTMWDEIKEEVGERREAELTETFWQGMVGNGCTTKRFHNTFDSAWGIINSLFTGDQAALQLTTDIVDAHLLLKETKAGVTLSNELQRLIKDQKEATRKLKQQARKQGNPERVRKLNERKEEIEEKIRQTAAQLREMKIPFSKQVRLFFSGKLYR